ncbi:DUF1768-domain-containing protein [Tricholoma matsutake]|nr:DUF1768-domain-containing protein [Tricholoma matsutake 945]
MPALPPLPQGGVPGSSAPNLRAPGHFSNHPMAIRYNEDTDYWSFMNHSPHRIHFQDKVWPTATHLIEARKYLPGHPAVAEQIRCCGDVAHVYPISANYQQFQDPHWSENHMQILEEVLYLKFSQHADLRSKLWETEDAPLIYDDRSDPYWGVGPMGDGLNVHGQLLERVRARLLEGRNPPR